VTENTTADDLIGIEAYLLPAVGTLAFVGAAFYLFDGETASRAILAGLVYLELRRAFVKGAKEKAADLPGVDP